MKGNFLEERETLPFVHKETSGQLAERHACSDLHSQLELREEWGDNETQVQWGMNVKKELLSHKTLNSNKVPIWVGQNPTWV